MLTSSWMVMSAPPSSNAFTHSVGPEKAAHISAVLPYYSK